MDGWWGGKIRNITTKEDADGAEYAEGSRRDGHTTAATIRETLNLGMMATVMDAEMLAEVAERHKGSHPQPRGYREGNGVKIREISAMGRRSSN